ncbi:unnamed protein product [Cladocopium goreaui]|uniref:Uncharacterized protein n=1 Tax=Cladocopium goreaui TaxID=2562237 RepID=A0A9P1G1J0_9DINO|nr:unnamed protein product [Cladocopium goreaui]
MEHGHSEALTLLPSKMPLQQLAQLNGLCRPLRQACCGLLAAKLQAIHQVFDELILHAEVTFVWLVEEAQFEELPNLLLDFAKVAREGATKILAILEESIAIEGFAKDDSGGHDLVGEFRTIQAIAMASTKLSPRLKARGILRRSLRLQRLVEGHGNSEVSDVN